MTAARVKIAHLPTRIEHLPRVTEILNGPEIYVKRDDQTGLGFGGNKTRKLEFLVADAIHRNARTLITVGAIQSNHCRQTAAIAARFGLDCVLVLSGNEPGKTLGNLFLDKLFGASVVWAERETRDATLTRVFDNAVSNGMKPYLIPYGASNVIGMMGYVEAMEEFQNQSEKFDWIIVASSSGGTQAGMVLGAKKTEFQGKILGISIDSQEKDLRGIVSQLVQQGAGYWEIPITRSDDILINDHYLGGGYGVMGEPEIEAIHLFARLEGILLDPVYTSRAAAGMIDLIRKRELKKGEKVLFWHTGGTPALFAEPYLSQLQGIIG